MKRKVQIKQKEPPQGWTNLKNIETNCNRLVSGYKEIILGFDAVIETNQKKSH